MQWQWTNKGKTDSATTPTWPTAGKCRPARMILGGGWWCQVGRSADVAPGNAGKRHLEDRSSSSSVVVRFRGASSSARKKNINSRPTSSTNQIKKGREEEKRRTGGPSHPGAGSGSRAKGKLSWEWAGDSWSFGTARPLPRRSSRRRSRSRPARAAPCARSMDSLQSPPAFLLSFLSPPFLLFPPSTSFSLCTPGRLEVVVLSGQSRATSLVEWW
jgi:hypothetical protein